MRSKFLFCFIGAVCVFTLWLFVRLYQELRYAYEQSDTLSEAEYSWIFRLLLNLAGYSTVLLPAFVVYKYLERTKYFEKISNPSCVSRLLFAWFGPRGERLAAERAAPAPAPAAPPPPQPPPARAGELAFCACGLMAAYLVWGLLQEKIMTQTYRLPDGGRTRFSDSQFLVFVNRLLALGLAAAQLRWARRPLAPGPLHQYSYCALSNVVSAWCQYEALKYVSFPVQVLSKSCKVIPVMLMGRLVSGNKYAPYEYATAALISAGMALFLFGSRDSYAASGATSATTASGAALLALYMAGDSFTSTWQGELFARYGGAPLQMLAAVNLCSCLLTAAALRPAPALQLLQDPEFVTDVALLSLSSALGQLLIYRTIARFGAVVFAIIMTLRQAVSILVSCAVYGHAVSGAGGAGVALVLAAVLLRAHCRRRLAARRPRLPARPHPHPGHPHPPAATPATPAPAPAPAPALV